MPHIDSNRQICTVIVTVDAAQEVMPELLEHARVGLDEMFRDCQGFIGGALHVSGDGTKLVQYLQWDSEALYIECRDHPRWNALASTQQFMEHVITGRAKVDARTYTVVADAVPA